MEQTSFYLALKESQGLLLLLDEEATPFRRIWCDFEVYSAVTTSRMELDLVTVEKGKVKIMTENVIPGESAVAKSVREQESRVHEHTRCVIRCIRTC